MSAYSEFQTEFNDQACLISGLTEMGFEPKVFEIAQALEGYQGDKRKQTAEVIIPRRQVGSASNDIGFKKNEAGNFTAIISQFDQSRYNQAWLGKVKQSTAIAKTKKTMTQMGKRLVSSTAAVSKNGTQVQRLTFSVSR